MNAKSPDLVFKHNQCTESIFAEVIRPKQKYLIISVLYRPPNQNLQDFIDGRDSFVVRISKENKACYLMADWNLNLMKHHKHDKTSEFLDIMFSHASEVHESSDPSSAYDIFLSKYTDIYNNCFPLKKVKIKKYWFD